MRHAITLIFALLAGMALGQETVLNSSITIEPGLYNGEELMTELKKRNISVSYASGSLKAKSIEIHHQKTIVRALLEKVFNPTKYAILERDGKILIVPHQQNTITISGYVEDLISRERLIGVNVYLPQLGVGTTTNTFGYYSLSLQSIHDTLLLQASSIGYKDEAFKLNLNNDYKLDIGLSEAPQLLKEVVVEEKDQSIDNTQTGQVKLTAAEIKALPKFFGEEDILKVIQLLPGVQSSSEGGIHYIVRGGGPDQNLILLDGVPVYNAGHLFGFFSVFNPDAVKNIQFTKGGFPARYGGRLSSVLEIDMKEGDMQSYHGSGSIGLMASELTLEGPIVKDKASFMLSGRRTYFDLLYRPFLDGEDAGYYFADINAKLNYKFSRKDRLYLSFYRGRDKLFSDFSFNDQRSEGEMSYGNLTGALRWNHLFSDKLFSNFTATYTAYNLTLADITSSALDYDATRYFSKMEDIGFKYDFDYSHSPDHYIKYGLSYTHHTFKPGAIQYNSVDSEQSIDSLLSISPSNYSHDSYLYIEDDWRINSKWRLNMGLHYSAYSVESSFYHSLQPRLSARYLLTKNWALKASYTYMQQNVHLLTNSRIGLPTDLWVSSTDKVKPQKSNQWALSSTTNLWGDKFEFGVELYYKYMTNLIAFKEDVLFSSGNDWQDQITTGGMGNAYGCEALLRKTKGQTKGWIAYTLAKSTRHFEDINNGNPFPYKYDRRHDLKIVIDHSFSKRFTMAMAFALNSGIKATVPTGTFRDIYGHQSTIYSDRNAYTYPTYHRLDLSFNWTKQKKWGERTWTIGLYNAYNHQNPFYIYFDREVSGVAYQVSLFPIIPSFGYSFKF